MFDRSATRIAVSQFVLFGLLTYTFIALGITIDEDLSPSFHVSRRAVYAIAGCFAVPMLMSLLLLYGILKDKLFIIRGWLIFSILITVVLLCVLLSGAVYISIRLKIYWGVLLGVMPFVLTFWVIEGTLVVFSYLKKLENKWQVSEAA